MKKTKAVWTREELKEQLNEDLDNYPTYLAEHVNKKRLDREIAWLVRELKKPKRS